MNIIEQLLLSWSPDTNTEPTVVASSAGITGNGRREFVNAARWQPLDDHHTPRFVVDRDRNLRSLYMARTTWSASLTGGAGTSWTHVLTGFGQSWHCWNLLDMATSRVWEQATSSDRTLPQRPASDFKFIGSLNKRFAWDDQKLIGDVSDHLRHSANRVAVLVPPNSRHMALISLCHDIEQQHRDEPISVSTIERADSAAPFRIFCTTRAALERLNDPTLGILDWGERQFRLASEPSDEARLQLPMREREPATAHKNRDDKHARLPGPGGGGNLASLVSRLPRVPKWITDPPLPGGAPPPLQPTPAAVLIEAEAAIGATDEPTRISAAVRGFVSLDGDQGMDENASKLCDALAKIDASLPVFWRVIGALMSIHPSAPALHTTDVACHIIEAAGAADLSDVALTIRVGFGRLTDMRARPDLLSETSLAYRLAHTFVTSATQSTSLTSDSPMGENLRQALSVIGQSELPASVIRRAAMSFLDWALCSRPPVPLRVITRAIAREAESAKSANPRDLITILNEHCSLPRILDTPIKAEVACAQIAEVTASKLDTVAAELFAWADRAPNLQAALKPLMTGNPHLASLRPSDLGATGI
jgi:hypothetical protein